MEHGETAVVSALLPLPAGWTVLPQLILPGHQFHHEPDDMDVVVLGPSGIFLIEYRHWHGRIQLAAEGPWQHIFVAGGREERPNPLPQLEAKRKGLEAFLADRGLARVPVTVALAFPDRSPVEGATARGDYFELAGIPALPLGKLVAWLTSNDPRRPAGSLPREDQAAIAEQLRPNSPRRLINQYQLTSRLSRTEAKTTYLGWDTVLERPVLLQELNYDPYQQPDKLERVRNELLREAKLTMQLRHNHIVNVEHVIPRDDCYYVVTEWIEDCQTLAEVLARRAGDPFPVDQAVAIGLAIADALAYAHAQGIVHRDVRPDNVLVAPQGIVKVANFGHAKKADLGTRSTFDLRQMAQENPYVAPEFRIGQTGHHQVDQRADIFSLGAVLYQLLTGKLPHHLDEKYFEEPSKINGAVPTALDAVITKALRFDPAQRFSTMTAFRERLAEYLQPATTEGARYTGRKLVKRTRNSLVYQAYDEKLQRQVALKKLLLEPRLTEAERLAQLKQLLREAQLASSLVHPHIVSVFDHFIEDGDGYIVMEWLEGLNLREQLDNKQRLTLPQIKQIAAQVGDALQYAHSQGVVHRDIKPENIIFHQGQATVLDFGIAHTADRQSSADIGKTAGTARYMAPEVLAGQDIDVRADIFSLGVVLYELVTGQYPYEANVIMARYTELLLHAPPQPSGLNLDCDPELDPVLLKALEVDPERRYPTVADFQRDFLALEGRRPTRGGEYEERSGWPLLVMLSIVVFMLFLAVGLWVSQSYRTMFQVAPVPAMSPVASAMPSASPSPSPSPSPTPSPTPTPKAAAPAASWAGAPVSIEDVTVAVERVAVDGGRTHVVLRVDNRSGEPVAFLNRTDRPDLFSLADDKGRDYTRSLDIMSVDLPLLRVEPGQSISGGFFLNEEINLDADGLSLTLKEYGGKGRKFPLRSVKMVER